MPDRSACDSRMPVPVVLVYGYHAVMISDDATGSADQGGMFMSAVEFGDTPCMMTVEVGPDGLLVGSACCNATMSEDVARELYAALKSWLDRREALRNGVYGQC